MTRILPPAAPALGPGPLAPPVAGAPRGPGAGVVRRIASAGLVRLAQALLALLAALAAARLLGAAEYGRYALALSAMTLAAAVAGLGLPLVAVRETAGRSPPGTAAHGALIRFGPRAILGAGAAATALVAAAALLLPADLLSPGGRGLLVAAVAAGAPCALLRWYGGRLLGRHRPALGQAGDGLVRPLAFLAALGAAAAAGWRPDGGQAFLLQAGALGLALLATAAWARRLDPCPGRAPAVPGRAGGWLAAGLPLMAAGLLGLLQLNLDVLMLGLLADAEAAGIYHAAARLAQLAALPLVAANVVLAPLIAAHHAAGARGTLQVLLTRWARWTTAAAAAALVAAALAGGLAMRAFGAGFGAGEGALILLAAAQTANVACGSVAVVLSMTGHERDALAGMALGAAANAALNAVLIPAYGLFGAAVATAASTVLWNLVLLARVRRRLALDASVLGRPPAGAEETRCRTP